MTVDADLSLDPKLKAAIDSHLLRSGRSLDGLFTDWEPKPREPRLAGLTKIEAHVFGAALQLELTLDMRRGDALWRLAGDVGLPLEFDWVYKGDPSIKSQHPITLTLSLAHRARHELSIADGKLTNAGRRTTTVAYVQVGPSRFVRPRRSDALALRPGESAPLSEFDLPVGTNPAQVSVPPEAVRVEVGPDPFEDFQRDPGLLETVAVRNLLPPHDEARNTDLRYVEVRVVQIVGEGGDAVESSAGPFRLAPRGADGAEVAVPFLKPGIKPRKYRLEAAAFYQGGGSKDDLKAITIEGTSVEITDKSLPGR